MKFRKKNGIVTIVLEKDEKLKLETTNGIEAINFKSDGDKISIIGGSNLINSIKGEGMLEKVEVLPVVSSNDIIAKCDQWLDMFRKIHDKFKELVLTEEYRKGHMVMQLNFCDTLSFDDSTNRGKSIDLDIKLFDTIVLEGITINIPDNNESVYVYLLANVLSYYVSSNFRETKIDLMRFNGFIYSDEQKDDRVTAPMVANVAGFEKNVRLNRIVYSILQTYNLNIPTDQIIDNAKQSITNQPIGDCLDHYIEYSERQYNHIFEKSPERKRTQE